MVRYLKYILLLILLLHFGSGVAQNKKKEDSFPTYDQIRGNRKETVDYVHPHSKESVIVVPKTVSASRTLNAFSYDPDSVIYILNGKNVKQKKAEELANRKDVRIDRVSIGEVGKDGKRRIEIDFEPFKE